MVAGTALIGGNTTQYGTIDVPAFALRGANPFVMVLSVDVPGSGYSGQFVGYAPTFNISGTTISYMFPNIYGNGTNTYPATRILYGIR